MSRQGVRARIARLVLVVVVAAVLSLSWPSVSQGQVTPTLPQAWIDTTYAPPAGTKWCVQVQSPPPGCASAPDFQTALNSAQPGDMIILQTGTTYTGNFVLPDKCNPLCASWIYIQSSGYASLPAPGNRVDKTQASLMPKIINPIGDSGSTIQTASGADHYRFVGIEIATSWITQDPEVWIDVVDLSGRLTGGTASSSIVIDRCYVHGTPSGNTRSGILANGSGVAVVDSYVSDIHHTQGLLSDGDAMAIWTYDGSGPYKIVNNYLEGAGVNVLFGGANGPNGIPSDIEIRGNYFFKPLSWKWDPLCNCTNWVVKNLFELKDALRVLVEGNVFENSWYGNAKTQDGFAVLFTPRNQSGGAPSSAVQDVTFRNNVIRRTVAGMFLLGEDDINSSQQLQRALIQNNLFFDIGYFESPQWGGVFTALLLLMKSGDYGTADVTLNHNTAFLIYPSDPDAGDFLYGATPPHMSFSFFNTIVPSNRWGIRCEGVTPGHPVEAMASCFPRAGGGQNVIYGPWAPDPHTSMTPSDYGGYQNNNYFPASVSDVGFTDPANCNFRLMTTSPYYRAGSDGTDVGIDQDAIEAPIGVGPGSGGMGRTVLSMWPAAPFCN